jgi:hypothetical protein
MERSGSGDKIRKISPTEPAVAPSPSTTTTTTVNKEEGIVEEPSMEGKERLSFGADSKLQKEMERIERSIKMAAKRMNGQEKAKDGVCTHIVLAHTHLCPHRYMHVLYAHTHTRTHAHTHAHARTYACTLD